MKRRSNSRSINFPTAGGCASRSLPFCFRSRSFCFSTNRPITSISKARFGLSIIFGLYRATILVISHDRDLLDAVCDHILHLDQAKLALWRGNYSSFEQQRREQQAIQLKQKKKQDDQRRHLRSFVDRFRAKATKAAQA